MAPGVCLPDEPGSARLIKLALLSPRRNPYTPPMRILLLNPNTTPAITALLLAAASPAAAPGTSITPMTASKGVPYIASRAEAALAAASVLEILAEHHMNFDAAIIAAFGDPGLAPARELFPIPIIGLAEAGMLTACMLGARFGIVTFSPALTPWYHECIAAHGLNARSAGVFAAPGAFANIESVAQDRAEALVALAHQAIAAGADTIILAGAPLSGLATHLRDRIPVPLIDCAPAAIKQAEALIALHPKPPAAGSYARPGPKQSTGLDTPLSNWIAHHS